MHSWLLWSQPVKDVALVAAIGLLCFLFGGASGVGVIERACDQYGFFEFHGKIYVQAQQTLTALPPLKLNP